MPVYLYRCKTCGKEQETRQRFNDEPLSICAYCGKDIYRVIQLTRVIYNGSGFYSTDGGK